MKPERQELLDVYHETLSMDKTAKWFNVSKKTILNWMNSYNIRRFQRRTYKELLPAIKLFIQQGGYTTSEVAKALDISNTSVNNMCRRIGKPNAFNTFHKGYRITDSGYKQIRLPLHPLADSQGYVREHRLVMEQYLERYLDYNEIVHHIDEDKLNNSIENLELCWKQAHVSYHHKDIV